MAGIYKFCPKTIEDFCWYLNPPFHHLQPIGFMGLLNHISIISSEKGLIIFGQNLKTLVTVSNDARSKLMTCKYSLYNLQKK